MLSIHGKEKKRKYGHSSFGEENGFWIPFTIQAGAVYMIQITGEFHIWKGAIIKVL